MVKGVWEASTVYGTQIFQLSKRLKALKHLLRTLSKDHYQGIHARVVEARRALLDIQSSLLTAPSISLIQQEKALLLNRLMDVEESLLQ